MIRSIFLILAMGALALSAHAADWQADPGQSTLGFSGTAEGESFNGVFRTFTPEIRFDAADLENARFDVAIQLASADTANTDRDQTLLGSDFFAVRRFPESRYLATQFRDLGNGRFAADGTLALRGIEKSVTLEFSWREDGDAATLEGRAVVNRLDFDVGAGDWADASTIVHEIAVTTRLQLQHKGD